MKSKFCLRFISHLFSLQSLTLSKDLFLALSLSLSLALKLDESHLAHSPQIFGAQLSCLPLPLPQQDSARLLHMYSYPDAQIGHYSKNNLNRYFAFLIVYIIEYCIPL
jgi:hypothetical protein